ncbi:helix-hairpin-helix domain-containing protein [Cesiribacter andamanensis]|uniref:DNA polymerase/3'-5' exonuclease PolX n=1 Tax=Cesiribacter andamanensis AMV16 TaxID=1279009 RepID=M7N2F1_9BACT|nr:helix-hairpin-helix domain-containing protein [Cesiribacter andamanensis]EMR01482.1 DNA polymerase/3'-5' exonuclease PolX [Cesiribacter andamanensis AMV16]
MTDNKTIIRQLRLAATLLELHGENQFKIRSYVNAVFPLERLNEPLHQLSLQEISAIQGIGKSIAANIQEILERGSFGLLEELLAKTPHGVLRMLSIKGLGPKKVAQIWQEVGITDPEALLQACKENKLAKVKGFGAKTQETIKEALLFARENEGRLRYADLLPQAEKLRELLRQHFPLTEWAGEMRRCLEVINSLCFVVGHQQAQEVWEVLNGLEELESNTPCCGPYAWRGQLRDSKLPLEVHVTDPTTFASQLLVLTGSDAHIGTPLPNGQTLLQLACATPYPSEEALYEAAGLPYIPAELREGLGELELAAEEKLPRLIEYADLTGSLHNHTTYSDGKNTLREMAAYCRDMGLQYLGISDHSQSAYYAGGLQIEQVRKQHREIDALNQEMAPFRIFKGIESDILADGSLDYPMDQLAEFDFVVASIHANLNMSLEKATERLLTAIATPFTTMLGHPTGRLLLRRAGYPIDHKAVIDACARHGVIIEVNANPWRLDLDWRWLSYAQEQGVMISINPDAHETAGFHDMYFGTLVARKGGLTAERCFNAQPLEAIASHFEARKQKALQQL